MEFDKLIDIVFKIDDTINFLWNLYLGVCVVLLGWVFGAKVKWPLVKRITVSMTFILADLMNVTAQLDNYSLKTITLEELRQKRIEIGRRANFPVAGRAPCRTLKSLASLERSLGHHPLPGRSR